MSFYRANNRVPAVVTEKTALSRSSVADPDTVSNLQWQTIRDARAKHTRQRKARVVSNLSLSALFPPEARYRRTSQGLLASAGRFAGKKLHCSHPWLATIVGMLPVYMSVVFAVRDLHIPAFYVLTDHTQPDCFVVVCMPSHS